MSKENEQNTNSVTTMQTIIEKVKKLIFTYEGTIDAKTFFGCYVLLGIFGAIVLRATGGLIMSLVIVLFEGYTKSILVQKRCRDFGNDGTWYLRLYFLSYLVPATAAGMASSINSIPLILLQVVFAIIAVVWVVAFIRLLINKSVENKNMELTASFMKQRKTHIAVVVAASLMAIIMNVLWLYLVQTIS